MDQDTLSIEHQAVQIYDRGLSSLAWQGRKVNPIENDFDCLTVDQVRELINAPQAKERIQNLPSQTIYRSLKLNGVEACVDILPFLSEEQFTRLIDYDSWQQDEFILERAMAWVALYGKVDPTGEQFFNRFKNLDEEYQLSMLMGKVQVVDLETYEDLPDFEQDEYIPLPGQELYYRILCKEDAAKDFIKSLVDIGLNFDLKYTFAMLLHASYMPPNESEYLLERIRKAHIEEDGFVSYQESLSTFLPIDITSLYEKYRSLRADTHSALATQEGEDFWARVMSVLKDDRPDQVDDIKARLIFLANNLCAAAQIEPDQINELQELFRQVRAISSLGLEYLAQSQTAAGLEILQREHPKNIFRVGLSLVLGLTTYLVEDLSTSDLDFTRLSTAIGLGQWGRAQLLLDRDVLDMLGDERVSFLKGLMNRFPMILSEKEKNQFRYVPIDSRRGFAQLAQKSAAMAATMNLCAKLPDGHRDAHEFQVDKVLATAMAHLILDDLATGKKITQSELAAFYAMAEDAVRNKANFAVDQLLARVALEDFARRYSLDSNLETEDIRQLLLKDLTVLADQISALRIRNQREDAKDFFYVDG